MKTSSFLHHEDSILNYTVCLSLFNTMSCHLASPKIPKCNGKLQNTRALTIQHCAKASASQFLTILTMKSLGLELVTKW